MKFSHKYFYSWSGGKNEFTPSQMVDRALDEGESCVSNGAIEDIGHRMRNVEKVLNAAIVALPNKTIIQIAKELGFEVLEDDL